MAPAHPPPRSTQRQREPPGEPDPKLLLEKNSAKTDKLQVPLGQLGSLRCRRLHGSIVCPVRFTLRSVLVATASIALNVCTVQRPEG